MDLKKYVTKVEEPTLRDIIRELEARKRSELSLVCNLKEGIKEITDLKVEWN